MKQEIVTHSQEKDSQRKQSQSYPNVGITRFDFKATILSMFEDLKENSHHKGGEPQNRNGNYLKKDQMEILN